jgi:vacuolar protein sorting-associated protein 13A/C
MDQFSIRISPNQYEDIILLLSSIERMKRSLPYRKYRPMIRNFKSQAAKYWWRYAYRFVLEKTVQRRRRNWCWSHIKKHRDMVHNYIKLYKLKLVLNKEPDPELKQKLHDLEEALDVFNIILARRQAETQV